MPAYKDLDELIRNLIREEERKFREIERRISREFEKELQKAWTPLYSFTETANGYEYIIDIPKADLSTLKVESRPEKLFVHCKTRDGREYRLSVSLPEDADPTSMEVTRVKWLLKITFKKKKS